ncbi:MAG: M1 family metallopeptidase [Planctomycetaceae bacterium]
MAAFPRATALAALIVVCAAACTGASTSTVPPTGSPSTGSPASSPATSPPAVTAFGRTPGDPRYEVRLRSDAIGRTWTGSERVTFTNTGPEALDRIWLRVWSNGIDGCRPLAIDVTDLTGGRLGAAQVDCTALPIDLDATLAPGATTSLAMRVRIRLPIRNDRFGYHDGTALVGTALPTLAIHDDHGWNLAPFVRIGESFYSVTGSYRVALDVPAGLETAATGIAISQRTQGDRIVRTYAAERVRDFEWAAGGFNTLTGTVGSTRVRVWYRPQMLTPDRARRVLGIAVRSMRTFDAAFGAYPYPEVDVVVTAFVAYRGMEYPQIVFTNPGREPVAHELAHQWWYGLVGDDQYDSPWLDESFATWSQFLPFRPWVSCPSYAWPSASAYLTNGMGYWARHRDDYGAIYAGGGCMLADLASLFGLPAFERVLRAYAAAHAFAIVRTPDFVDAIDAAAEAQDVTGFDPATFWSTWRVRTGS